MFFSFLVTGMLITACSNGQNPTPLPTVVLEDNVSALAQGTQSADGVSSAPSTSGIIASGVLVSDQQVDLAFQTSGNVQTINTSIGQSVKAGDVLVILDDTLLQLQFEQANLALNELTSPLAISNAQKAVAEDQSALNQAQGVYNWWLALSSHEDLLAKAKADLVVVEDALVDAQEDYEKYSNEGYSEKEKATAYQRLFEAQQRVKEAKTKVNLYENVDPYQLAINKAAVDVARAKLADDQALLAVLLGEELPENPTGFGFAQLFNKLQKPTTGTVEIIDINKLGDEMGDKTVAVEAFEGNNLVLVDEGHRGTGTAAGAWMSRREALVRGGFAFE
ncbi:MAG: biotin/lipoyl-binding protein, partial [Saprospiraceae bacterium]|nr:biotin/lipoyl-binding protein [Saprospiraceae bacterium]